MEEVKTMSTNYKLFYTKLIREIQGKARLYYERAQMYKKKKILPDPNDTKILASSDNTLLNYRISRALQSAMKNILDYAEAIEYSTKND